MKVDKEIPQATKKRLVLLQQLLKTWNTEKITSIEISKKTNWSASSIRHDLWLIGFDKGVSNGYKREQLLEKISLFCKPVKNLCIVGLGRLGSALLDQNLFDKEKFCIKAGFDSNLNRVEILRSSFPLYPSGQMSQVMQTEKIEYAVLAVLDKDAQNMAEKLVNCGIKGIVNMTNTVLCVPKNIKVENISINNALLCVL